MNNYLAIGRRKSAGAQVSIYLRVEPERQVRLSQTKTRPDAPFLINKKTIDEYFQNDTNSIEAILFFTTFLPSASEFRAEQELARPDAQADSGWPDRRGEGPEGKGGFEIQCFVSGGGLTAQKEAICLALARAICKMDQKFRPILKKKAFLTQDSRIKERRKYGLKKARKAPQFSKR
uniref:Small ribosomal subunit protein uS9c n=1 Tax=Caulerpa cliftonii TaxID=1004391 RepID=A0A1C9JBJ9_9CHLO|nr:ribosomal protein S9 [Caulerpa cliftonii]AOP19229.1 ribosomal protein S9 [Caulerpa cliftonii]